jgi:tRNA A37 methylthiotransferase MiaB
MVEKLQTEIADQINRKLIGEIVEILVEGKEKRKWMGRTTTDKPVFFEESERDYYGKLVEVKITHASAWSLQGELTAIK